MKLTRRQKNFLEKFISLYREAGEALHYSAVAKRMHLSNVTAYEMLRLLESKGLVKSEYRRFRSSGPGRSSVVFYPLERVTASVAALGEEERKWKETTSHILRTLAGKDESSHQKALEYLLEHLPSQSNPALIVMGTITALLLNLHQLREETRKAVIEELRKAGFPTESGVQVLVGVVIGLVAAGMLDRENAALLMSHLSNCRDALATLSPEKQSQVSAFVQEVLSVLKW